MPRPISRLLVSCLIGTALFAEPIKTPQHVLAICQNETNHPGDYPFPTEITFAAFADHAILSITTEFDPDSVKRGDVIFLRDWYIPWFTRYVHPKIKHPYILISNDSDSPHPDQGLWDYDEKHGWPPPIESVRTLLYDSKVAAWFCKNMLLSRHPKITQLPIGQNILYWGHFDRHKDHLLELAQNPVEKKHLLYMSMQLASHPSRIKIADLLEDKPFCLSHINRVKKGSTKLSKVDFYHELAQSCFTVAPPGYGPDTVRFWESIVVDCIPIIKHSPLDDLYSDLPVVFVHSWDQINETFLHEKYDEITHQNLSKEKAYFKFWADQITTTQNKVRNGDHAFSTLDATRFPSAVLQDLNSVLKKHKGHSKKSLLCKGAVMSLRPFEIAEKNQFFSTIYVQDKWGAWGHERATSHLKKYVASTFFTNLELSRFKPVNYWTLLSKTAQRVSHVFFDLSYLRSDLCDDLDTVYKHVKVGTLLCGNLAHDEYVKEVLLMFEQTYNVAVLYQGDIWYMTKS